jgi:hypothetical protein
MRASGATPTNFVGSTVLVVERQVGTVDDLVRQARDRRDTRVEQRHINTRTRVAIRPQRGRADQLVDIGHRTEVTRCVVTERRVDAERLHWRISLDRRHDIRRRPQPAHRVGRNLRGETRDDLELTPNGAARRANQLLGRVQLTRQRAHDHVLHPPRGLDHRRTRLATHRSDRSQDRQHSRDRGGPLPTRQRLALRHRIDQPETRHRPSSSGATNRTSGSPLAPRRPRRPDTAQRISASSSRCASPQSRYRSLSARIWSALSELG